MLVLPRLFLSVGFLLIVVSSVRGEEPAIKAMFTQAYKALVEENEAVSRRSSKNPDKTFFSLMDSASKSIQACFYDIGDPDAAAAFIRASERGVLVQILTDSDNLFEKEDGTQPRRVIEQMRAAGIAIRGDERSPLMHHKFMIVDRGVVWLGSMNLTTSSMYHHNNNALRIRSARLAAAFGGEFSRLFSEGQFGGPRPGGGLGDVRVGGVDLRVYFSPLGGTRDAILKELAKAEESIHVLAFSFTDEEMAKVLIEKRNAGVEVDSVFDDCLIDHRSVYSLLRQNGVSAWRDGNQALMHHKVMVIDGKTVITGSFNFSKNAEHNNNEDCVILSSRELALRYEEEFARVRRATHFWKTLPPYDHPACRREASPVIP